VPYSWTCDEPLDGKGRKPINYSTTLGPVAVARATARCPRCHQGVPYLDEYLEITPQGMTPALASAVALMGTCEADEQAAALLQKNLHQEIDDNKEHLYEAGEALYPDDPAQVRTWVKTIRQPLWEGEVEAALARLARMQPRGSDAEKRQKQEALDALTRYLRNPQGLIAYAQHRERDRDLGSGTVESTCKQLFNMRMKGPGMFWSVPGAQAIIILRSVLLSDRWEQIWQPAFQEEQSLAVAA